MASEPLKGQSTFFDNNEPDAPTNQEIEQFVKPGELWTITSQHCQHRLLCGNTGIKADMDRLMGGKKAHLIHTDPPYNVAVDTVGRFHGSKQRGTVKTRMLHNDALPEPEFTDQLRLWFHSMCMALHSGRSFYFWGGYSNCSRFPAIMKSVGLHFSQAIIWVKKRAVLSRRDFNAKHEWCFYGWKQRDGYSHYFNFISGISDVWTYPSLPAQYAIHLTEKPVEIPACAIISSSRPGELVLDPFAGSGSTLIAADKLDRICYLMELDPWYASIILDRCKGVGMSIKKEML